MSYKRKADAEHYLCSMCGEITHENDNVENHLASCAFYEIRKAAFLEAAEMVEEWRNNYIVLSSIHDQKVLDVVTEAIFKLLREKAEE